MRKFDSIFKNSKLIIGMVHLPPLPGSAHYDRSKGMDYILDVAHEDLINLQNNGIDSVMFGNEGDRPYLLKASNETFSAMSYVIGQLKKEIKIPFGINYLWDPVATVSLACVAEADFAREVFTGVYDSDMGLWEPKAAEALKLRSDLGNKKLKLLFNINAEFAAPLGNRDISQKAKSAVFSSTADAICVSGPITGESVDISNLILAKEAVKDLVPVFANTGVKFETLDEILKVADGCVVGTSLKYKGNTWNQVDGERVRKFMDKVNDIRNK